MIDSTNNLNKIDKPNHFHKQQNTPTKHTLLFKFLKSYFSKSSIKFLKPNQISIKSKALYFSYRFPYSYVESITNHLLRPYIIHKTIWKYTHTPATRYTDSRTLDRKKNFPFLCFDDGWWIGYLKEPFSSKTLLRFRLTHSNITF